MSFTCRVLYEIKLKILEQKKKEKKNHFGGFSQFYFFKKIILELN